MQQIKKTMGQIWGAVWPAGAGGRPVASLRGLDPRISPDLDLHLRQDASGAFFVNCRAKRVARDQVEALVTGIDGLLDHIRVAADTVPVDKTPFRNLWAGQAYAIDDLQLSGATIDVNLSRRAGIVEIDVPVATAEHPVTLTPDGLAAFAAALRRLMQQAG